MSSKFDEIIRTYKETTGLAVNTEATEGEEDAATDIVNQKAADGQPLSPAEQKLLDQQAKDASAAAKSQKQQASNARIQIMRHKGAVQGQTSDLRRGAA